MSNGPEIEALASPPTSEPWVPLWPLQPSALGELAYGQTVALTFATATSEATATPIVTAPAITLDGNTPIEIEWLIPAVAFGDQPTANLYLFDGSTSIGQIWRLDASWVTVNTFMGYSPSGSMRLTPSAGSHTYSIRGSVTSGAGMTVYCGPGSVGQWVPAKIRVSLAAPIMPHVAGAALPVSYGTSLPGGPLDGQEAILVDSVTNPTYQWRFRYNAGSSSAYKWEFIGGAPWVILPPPFTPSAIAAYEQDLQAGAFLNIPRNGTWICETSADIGSPTPDSGQYMGFSTTDRVGQWAKSGTEASIFYRNLYAALTAGGVVSNYFYCSTGISQFNRRLISVLPVRVS